MSVVEREQLDGTLAEIQMLPEIAEPKTRQQILLDAATAAEEYGYGSGSRATQHPSSGYGLCVLGAVGYAGGVRTWPSLLDEEEQYDWCAAADILGAPVSAAYRWSDRLDIYPRRRWFGRKVAPASRIANCLRLMADGATFADASSAS